MNVRRINYERCFSLARDYLSDLASETYRTGWRILAGSENNEEYVLHGRPTIVLEFPRTDIKKREASVQVKRNFIPYIAFRRNDLMGAILSYTIPGQIDDIE